MMTDIQVNNLIMAIVGLLIMIEVLLSILIGRFDRMIKLLSVIAIKADYIEGRKAAGIED